MKLLFCGIGSIAKRHIRNIEELDKEDFFDEKPLIDKLHYPYNFSELKDYTAIFITNPTSEHYKTLINLLRFSDNFFIEKPVFDIYDIKKYKEVIFKGKTVYVAAPLRYSAPIQWIKDNIKINEIISMRIISSSYLPLWRKGTDYRKTYSAIKKLGGGVELDLIHEWDYLIYLFGIPEKVKSFKRKISNLEIDTNDIAAYIAEYKNMIVELHLDYFGRVPRRQIEIFTNDDLILIDLIKGSVKFLKNKKVIRFNTDRNDMHKKELASFFNIIAGKEKNENDIKKAIETMKIGIS
ncbi:MAG: gfo/Idh/MocA family oxidoreductase [Clostridiales Family XIII bacterium]|jgi:predicted dehydrogenase|nr:gfo/Idh/MocA family oxidoreductase [Clostridiales Family XIII bacterium]